MSPKIYRFSIFNSISSGHGGDKRTAQISEILIEIGIDSERLPKGMDPPVFTYHNMVMRILSLKYFLRVLRLTGWDFNPKKLYKTMRLASQLDGIFNLPENKSFPVILWESTRMEYSYVVPFFKSRKLKIIALPHNIESLVPGLRSGLTNKKSPYWLSEEISLLKACDFVFAISREDTLLLKQLGVKAEYLPYYPTELTIENLLKVREARVKRKCRSIRRKSILMLGSAINYPTKEGMKDRINFFSEHPEICYDLTIAGYGTDQLKYLLKGEENIKIPGEVTDNHLTELMIETDLLLIHQPPTSGSLTRIIESLIAGIPVTANFVSSRNYFDMNGLYTYNDDEQLINYLQKNDFTMPQIPEKPLYEIEMFKRTLSKIISAV